MTTDRLRDRAAAFFLLPARSVAAPGPATVPAETRAMVLGAPPEAIPLAAALALTLRAAERAPTALVATWAAAGHGGPPAVGVTSGAAGDDGSPAAGVTSGAAGDNGRSQLGLAPSTPAGGDHPATRGIAVPSASRLAARLGARELLAVARGRLAWLPLPQEPARAAATLRGAAAVVDAPVVTALTGPRPPELEPLVEEHDLVVVAAEPGSPLAVAAVEGLRDRSVSVIACRPLPRGPARALALAGVAAPRLDPPLQAARSNEALL